jgi:CBS domain-containing protein
MTCHKTVGDVMTRDVVTVEPTTTFKEIVRLMDGYGISGVPVVDGDNCPVGVVTQADLLVKEAHPEVETDVPMFERPGHRLERRKATGQVALELMSRPPVPVRADAGLVQAARRMAEARVKRLIVVDDKDRLAGIVSREDLLEVFLRPDAEIREEIVDQVILHEWLMDPIRFVVRVRDGVVSLRGQIERRSLIPLLIGTVRGVDGVVAVDTRLGWDWDDTDAARHLTTITGRTT